LNAEPSIRARFVRFNAVGAIGIGVQLLTLALLKSGLGMHYLWATALAVEAAILHNFVWHVKWTWRDRSAHAPVAAHLSRLWKFHLGNGAVSLLVNLVLMRLLTGSFGMNYLLANVIAIAAGGVANFLVSERMVFLPHDPGRGD
jgi:putative flippase GtrA